MAKSINKLKLCWYGKSILLKEYFRVLKNKGVGGANRFVKMIYNAIKNERLIEHDKKAIVHFFIPPIPSQSFARHLRTYTDSLILKQKIQHLGDVLISTTRECPYNCWYCSVKNTPHGEMKIEDIKKTIHTLKEWGTSTIGFTGGEPLLRTDTDEIIRQYSDELTFIIFTSGYGLNPARAKKLKECGLFYIAISLDSYDKAEYDKTRGVKGAYEHSIEAIKNAKKAGLYTIIQSVITRSMLANKRILKFINFVKELDVEELLLLAPLGTGRIFDCDNEVFLRKNEHDQLKVLHDEAVKNMELPKIYSFADMEDHTKLGCGAGIYHSYIDINGDLWPCNYLPISLGNILKEPDTVYKRLKRYFKKPCSHCILMKERMNLQKLSNGKLPIPFEKAKRFLEEHIESIGNEDIPDFYTSVGRYYD